MFFDFTLHKYNNLQLQNDQKIMILVHLLSITACLKGSKNEKNITETRPTFSDSSICVDYGMMCKKNQNRMVLPVRAF